MSETELKLAAPPRTLPKVQRALLDLAPGSTGSRSTLTTTYYDTADRTLQRRGLSLRVREAGGRFVQTVKANGATEAGIFVRGEWEDEIGGAEPDLRAPHSAGCLPQGIGGDLKPVFATEVKRTTIPLEPSPSLHIEAAIDRGEIRASTGALAVPISEVELELKRGDPGALFDVALGLLGAAPLRIETHSKAERGYAAATGEASPAAPVLASPIALDPEMTVETALQAIGRAGLAHLLRNEAATLAGEPEGVHQMRVACRRIRSAISAFKKMLPAAERRWVSAELDQLDDILGPARNLDVFAADLLAPSLAVLPAEPALDLLAAAVDTARRAAYVRIGELIRSPRYTKAVLRLLRWFEAQGWRGGDAAARSHLLSAPIGDVAPRVLDRRSGMVRKRGKGFRRATAKERHKLRIAVKELRYTGELLGSLFDPKAVQTFGKYLKKLQDDLGYANDVRVGREVVAKLHSQAQNKKAVSDAGARVLRWHEHTVRKGEQKVRKHLRRLDRVAPFWKSRHPREPAVVGPGHRQKKAI